LIDDLETSDYDMFIDVIYDGIPFTGIAYEDNQKIHSEYSYLNGYGHGRSFSIYPSGQLNEEFYMEKGVELERTLWYENGLKKEYYRKKPFLYQEWNSNGILHKESTDQRTRCWYDSGQPKSILIKKSLYTFFFPTGQWVVKIPTEYEYVVMDTNLFEYNEPYMEEHYKELWEDKDAYYYFSIWLIRRIKADNQNNLPTNSKAEEILFNMIKGQNRTRKCEGMNLAGNLKVYKALPYIQAELDNNKIPPTTSDPKIRKKFKYNHEVVQQAKISIEKLTRNE